MFEALKIQRGSCNWQQQQKIFCSTIFFKNIFSFLIHLVSFNNRFHYIIGQAPTRMTECGLSVKITSISRKMKKLVTERFKKLANKKATHIWVHKVIANACLLVMIFSFQSLSFLMFSWRWLPLFLPFLSLYLQRFSFSLSFCPLLFSLFNICLSVCHYFLFFTSVCLSSIIFSSECESSS